MAVMVANGERGLMRELVRSEDRRSCPRSEEDARETMAGDNAQAASAAALPGSMLAAALKAHAKIEDGQLPGVYYDEKGDHGAAPYV